MPCSCWPSRRTCFYITDPCTSASLGFRVNFAQSTLSPSQRISFLGTVIDSARMRAVVTPEHALAIQQLAASFKLRVPLPPQNILEDAGPHGLSIFGTSVGPALHAAPSVLAETLSSSTCLASRTPSYQGEPGALCATAHRPSAPGRRRYLHINGLEMLAVWLGLSTFLPDLRGHNILVCSDNMTVVS